MMITLFFFFIFIIAFIVSKTLTFPLYLPFSLAALLCSFFSSFLILFPPFCAIFHYLFKHFFLLLQTLLRHQNIMIESSNFRARKLGYIRNGFCCYDLVTHLFNGNDTISLIVPLGNGMSNAHRSASGTQKM